MDKELTDKKVLVDTLKAEQESTKTNKYRQVSRRRDGDIDYEIHEYSGPDGIGYQIVFYKEVGGKHYTMSKSVGPDTWRNYDWMEVINDK